MKKISLFGFLILFFLLSENALAKLALVWKGTEARYSGPHMQLIASDDRTYWVKAHIASSSESSQYSYLQLENFFDRAQYGQIKLDFTPALFPLGQSHHLISSANASVEWRAVKPDGRFTKVERRGELTPVLAVTGSAAIDSGYVVAGIVKDKMAIKRLGQDKRPILIRLNQKLQLIRELRIPDKGEINSVFSQDGKIYAVLDYEQKPSEILILSSTLAILNRYRVPTGAVTAIPLRDGGFAITYTALPGMDVVLEKRDANLRTMWKKTIFTRKGISSMLYALCELPDGLAAVGKRDDRLLVVRVGSDGRHLRITEDTSTGLRVASSDPYLVAVQGDNIHIRGVAQSLAGSGDQVAFHFVETP